MENIDIKILEVIKNNIPFVSPLEGISLDSPISSLGITSLNFIKIIVALESEFEFEFNDENLNVYHFRTLHDLICHVKKQIGDLTPSPLSPPL